MTIIKVWVGSGNMTIIKVWVGGQKVGNCISFFFTLHFYFIVKAERHQTKSKNMLTLMVHY